MSSCSLHVLRCVCDAGSDQRAELYGAGESQSPAHEAVLRSDFTAAVRPLVAPLSGRGADGRGQHLPRGRDGQEVFLCHQVGGDRDTDTESCQR